MAKVYRFDKFHFVDILPKQVTYFLELADCLSISKAAERLGVQQPGLSRALQKLESDLGQKLFQRRSNGLALTKAGEQFLSAVKNTKYVWENEFKKITANLESPSGIFKIGFHSSFGHEFFPNIVEYVGNAYPNVEIEVHTLSSHEVTRRVNEQNLDMGIVISKVRFPELMQKKIGVDYLASFQADPSTPPKRVMMNPEMQMSGAILRKYTDTKKVYVKDYQLIAEACVKTNDLALLPYSVAKKFQQLKQVSGAYLKADISCIIHKEKLRSKAYKELFEVALKACHF